MNKKLRYRGAISEAIVEYLANNPYSTTRDIISALPEFGANEIKHTMLKLNGWNIRTNGRLKTENRDRTWEVM